VTDEAITYSAVDVQFDREKRAATLTITGPDATQPSTPAAIVSAGDQFWPLRAFRELDDALLRLRVAEPLIGTIVLKTRGDQDAMIALDELLLAHQDHWLVREILHFMKRTLKRLDLTSRSFFALIEPGSCFAGSLFELALAADRSYMLADDATAVALSPMDAGLLPMGSGLSRLQARFLGDDDHVRALLSHDGAFGAEEALRAGLVTFAPDEIDWDDELRLAVEERTAMSPDALTGMEANLRFAGPETLETKIFGRLSAWQNWIFTRPNATGERGALTLYGKTGQRPELDWRRT
jgi:benzoyl-CoA-dihydrodiol lyase